MSQFQVRDIGLWGSGTSSRCCSTSGVCLDFLRVGFFASGVTLRVADGCQSDIRADIYIYIYQFRLD